MTHQRTRLSHARVHLAVLLLFALVGLGLTTESVEAAGPEAGEEYLVSTDVEGSQFMLRFSEIGRSDLREGNRYLAGWEYGRDLGHVFKVKFVPDGGGGYFVRARFGDGLERELNWASLYKEKLGEPRRMAAWTTNLGYLSVRFVPSTDGYYVRSSFDGIERELSWTSVLQDGKTRRLAAWTPNLGNQPIQLQGEVGIPERGMVTDGTYYWLLNGDGTRNWLARSPACAGRATRIPNGSIYWVSKRHAGENSAGYTLDGEDLDRVCRGDSSTRPARILTDGRYYWLVNADGSRNWISEPSQDCRKAAETTSSSSIEQFPKRHGGTGGYTLSGWDAQLSCSVVATASR